MPPLDALFLESRSPIAPSDLGRGARLLVPNGLSFGALQLRKSGRFHDWFRDEPDRHQVAGSRHALHLGVDLAFYVHRGRVHMLPADLPVRSPADGIVAAACSTGTRELAPGGIIVIHGDDDDDDGVADDRHVRPFTYLGDVRDLKRPGERVRANEVVAHTLLQRHRGPERVLVHFGIGLSIPGHGLQFIDPCALLRRWGVRHPVCPGSTCTPNNLRTAHPGRWRSPGAIEGGVPGGEWDRGWRTRY